MKKLDYFTYFKVEEFFKGKRFMCIGQREWKDYHTKEVLGTIVETVIVQDKTDYGVKDGSQEISNIYEKVTFKVPKVVTIPMNVEIFPKNSSATIYGEYRQFLSVVAEDIEIISK